MSKKTSLWHLELSASKPNFMVLKDRKGQLVDRALCHKLYMKHKKTASSEIYYFPSLSDYSPFHSLDSFSLFLAIPNLEIAGNREKLFRSSKRERESNQPETLDEAVCTISWQRGWWKAYENASQENVWFLSQHCYHIPNEYFLSFQVITKVASALESRWDKK